MKTLLKLTVALLATASLPVQATTRGSAPPTWLAKAITQELLTVATPAPQATPMFGNPAPQPDQTPSVEVTPPVPTVKMEPAQPKKSIR